MLYSYEVQDCEVVWAIRHKSICHTFVDEGAAVFFLPHLEDSSSRRGDDASGAAEPPVKRTKYAYEQLLWEGEQERGKGKTGAGSGEGGVEEEGGEGGGNVGSALGPDWQAGWQMRGRREVCICTTLHSIVYHMNIT